MLSRIFRDELIRKKQIDTLKIFNDNVTELQEDVEYQVEFTSGNNKMALLVSLGPEFPLVKPVLKITPPVRHPWVNEHSEITSAPGLLNFTVHSDLGRVVQAIIREFQRKAPPLLSDVGAGASTMQPIGTDVAAEGRASPTYGLPMYPISHGTPSRSCYQEYSSIAISSSQNVRIHSATFPELSNMTNEELQKLSENEDRLDEFIQSLPQTIKMNNALDDLMTKNEEIASANISKDPLIRKLKETLREKLNTVATSKNSFEQHSQEHHRISEKYAPRSIKESLRLAAVRSDEESENIAEQFLNGEIDADEFVMSYTEKRMLSYCRKTKEEKLSSQLKELQRAGY